MNLQWMSVVKFHLFHIKEIAKKKSSQMVVDKTIICSDLVEIYFLLACPCVSIPFACVPCSFQPIDLYLYQNYCKILGLLSSKLFWVIQSGSKEPKVFLPSLSASRGISAITSVVTDPWDRPSFCDSSCHRTLNSRNTTITLELLSPRGFLLL